MCRATVWLGEERGDRMCALDTRPDLQAVTTSMCNTEVSRHCVAGGGAPPLCCAHATPASELQPSFTPIHFTLCRFATLLLYSMYLIGPALRSTWPVYSMCAMLLLEELCGTPMCRATVWPVEERRRSAVRAGHSPPTSRLS